MSVFNGTFSTTGLYRAVSRTRKRKKRVCKQYPQQHTITCKQRTSCSLLPQSL